MEEFGVRWRHGLDVPREKRENPLSKINRVS
jgi:hypothetical protein